MARALEFDYTTALERGSRVFWATGYANTSLRELLETMEIGEGSFYNTLKSKRHAYLECLKHYNATVNRSHLEAMHAAPTAAAGVRALFRRVLDCLDDPRTPSRVCLMAGSLTPEVLAEPELRVYVEQQMALMAETMTARLAADRQAGVLSAGVEPGLTAAVIVTYLQGLWRMALIAYDRPRFELQIGLFLNSLGL